MILITLFITDANNLSGAIPTALGQLTNLSFLNLRKLKCVFCAIITSILFCRKTLPSISMTDNNKLSGRIPTELVRLSSLTKLYLFSNNLSGTVPTFLAALVRLGKNYILCGGFVNTWIGPLTVTITSTEYLLLNNNSLTGNLTAIFCNRAWINLTADCKSGNVECSCCVCT